MCEVKVRRQKELRKSSERKNKKLFNRKETKELSHCTLPPWPLLPLKLGGLRLLVNKA
jgi:hypothetical protein